MPTQRNIEESQLPSTDQAVRMIDTAEEKLQFAEHAKEISPTGKQAMQESFEMLESFKEFLQRIDSRDELQNIILGLSKLPSSLDIQVVDSEKFESVSDDIRNLLKKITDAFYLVVKSHEFQDFISQSIDIITEFIELVIEIVSGSVESAVKKTDMPTEMPDSVEKAKEQVDMAKESANEFVQVTKKELKANVDTLTQDFNNRIDTLSSRTGKMLTKLSEDQKLKAMLQDVEPMVTKLYSDFTKLGEDTQSQVENIWNDPNVKLIMHNVKCLLENLLGGKPLDGLLNNIKKTYTILYPNINFGELAYLIRGLVMDPLDHHSVVHTKQYGGKKQKLINMFQNNVDSLKSAPMNEIIVQAKQISLDMRTLTPLRKLTESTLNLIKCLFLNENGEFTIKTELWSDAQSILSLVADSLQNIEVGEISGKTDEFEFLADHVNLDTKEILPSKARIRFTSDIDTEKYQMPVSLLELKFAKINAAAKSFRFWYKKKTFPSLEDSGTGTISFGNEGLTLWIDLLVNPNSPHQKHLFKITRVNASIPDLDFDVTGAKHEMLYSLFSPLIRQKMRESIEAQIEQQVKNYLLSVEDYLLSGTTHLTIKGN